MIKNLFTKTPKTVDMGEANTDERLNWIFEEQDRQEWADYQAGILELGPFQKEMLERKYGNA
jgi:hypothetical protein